MRPTLWAWCFFCWIVYTIGRKSQTSERATTQDGSSTTSPTPCPPDCHHCTCSPICHVYDTCCRNPEDSCPGSLQLARGQFSRTELMAPPAECPDSLGVFTITRCPIRDVMETEDDQQLVNASNITLGLGLTPLPVLDMTTGLVYINELVFACYRSNQSKPRFFFETLLYSTLAESNKTLLSIGAVVQRQRIPPSFIQPVQDERIISCSVLGGKTSALRVLVDFNSPEAVRLEVNREDWRDISLPYLQLACDSVSSQCTELECAPNAQLIDGVCHSNYLISIFSPHHRKLFSLQQLEAIGHVIACMSQDLHYVVSMEVLEVTQQVSMNMDYFEFHHASNEFRDYRNVLKRLSYLEVNLRVTVILNRNLRTDLGDVMYAALSYLYGRQNFTDSQNYIVQCSNNNSTENKVSNTPPPTVNTTHSAPCLGSINEAIEVPFHVCGKLNGSSSLTEGVCFFQPSPQLSTDANKVRACNKIYLDKMSSNASRFLSGYGKFVITIVCLLLHR